MGGELTMEHTTKPQGDAFDLCILGGGLAGLALSIQVAEAGFRVALFEKESYPFHRVCGEYISMESYPFLQRLGLDLDGMGLPRISRLQVTAPDGTSLKQELGLGGFGISRYRLDESLAGLATRKGVRLFTGTRVEDASYGDEGFQVFTSAARFHARAVAGCFGKRSNLDLRWKRPFALKKPRPIDNLIGVKYHVAHDMPKDLIALHNFDGGYCGMSAVEDGMYCLCYLTTAENLRSSGNSIPEMEERVLMRNPFLEEVFRKAQFLRSQPVTISQVGFQRKGPVNGHVLYIGDAAGMITPLCGNGMSMALHGSLLAAKRLVAFLEGRIGRQEMEESYTRDWSAHFDLRLKAGRSLHALFGKERITGWALRILKPMPSVTRTLIGWTHGKPF
jgi:flavin-dependent dehydrogenase